MAGFIDTLFGNADQTQALGLLGVGMMNGGFGQGAGLAMQHLAQAPERRRKGLLGDLQIQDLTSKIEARKAQQDFERQFFGMGRAGPATSPGVPGAVPGAPGAPQSAGPGGMTAQQISQQYGIPMEAVIADFRFNGGKGISEMLFKRGTPDMTVSNGYVFDKNRMGAGFLPQMNVSNDGKATMVRIGPDGLPVVEAPRGALNTYAGYQNVQEGTKAAHDPVQVAAPDGSMRYVPRAQVVRPQPAAAGDADADRFAILTQELAKAKATGNVRDAAAIEAEISRLAPSARTAASPSGLAVDGTYQATPTSAQAAEAAAAKERAVADAKSASERDASRAKKSTQAGDMLGYIAEARKLLQAGPTSSGVGAVVDGAMGLVGRSTKGGDVAAQLETISGWMVSNVPRMEGPQSNFDVQNYKTMAALVGDKTQPLSRRLAALDTLETLQRKYAHLNETPAPTGGATGSWDQPLPKPMKGMVRNGYRFKGGDPSSPSSWEKM